MSAKTEAILTRTVWTFVLALGSFVAVVSPTGLFHVAVWKEGAASGIIAVAVAIKNGVLTPPEAKN